MVSLNPVSLQKGLCSISIQVAFVRELAKAAKIRALHARLTAGGRLLWSAATSMPMGTCPIRQSDAPSRSRCILQLALPARRCDQSRKSQVLALQDCGSGQDGSDSSHFRKTWAVAGTWSRGSPLLSQRGQGNGAAASARTDVRFCRTLLEPRSRGGVKPS